MAIIHLVILALFFSYVNADEDFMHIPKGYIYSKEFNTYYRYIQENLDVKGANVYCTEEGAKLFVPESAKEANFAIELIPKDISKTWIGAGGSEIDKWTTLHDTEGGNASYLRTLPDIEVVPKPWWFFAMKNPTKYELTWWNTKLSFICKKTTRDRKFTDEKIHQLVKNGYIYNASFNALYKRINTHSYPSGLMFCFYDGAMTLIPESKEESLISRYMNITDLTFVGISRQHSRNFMTIEGKNISDGYIHWAINEPKPKRNFVAIDDSGKYYSLDYDQAREHICKIKLPMSQCYYKHFFGSKPDSKIFVTNYGDKSRTSTFFEPFNVVYPVNGPKNILAEFTRKKYIYGKPYESFYKLYNKTASQWTAALICSSDKSHLFYPDSMEEARNAFKLVPKNVSKIWVGVMITPQENMLTFTGLSVVANYTKTNLTNTRRGLVLNRNLIYEDADYRKEFMFLCKKNVGAPSNQSDIDKDDLMMQGYNFHSEFDAWYKYFNVNETLEFALAQCLVDGSTLFVPKTKKELYEIIKFTNISELVWVGVTKFLRDYFVTTAGQLASDFYYKWAKDQPKLQHDFAVLKQNGEYLTTDTCNRHTFICKKSARRA